MTLSINVELHNAIAQLIIDMRGKSEENAR